MSPRRPVERTAAELLEDFDRRLRALEHYTPTVTLESGEIVKGTARRTPSGKLVELTTDKGNEAPGLVATAYDPFESRTTASTSFAQLWQATFYGVINDAILATIDAVCDTPGSTGEVRLRCLYSNHLPGGGVLLQQKTSDADSITAAQVLGSQYLWQHELPVDLDARLDVFVDARMVSGPGLISVAHPGTIAQRGSSLMSTSLTGLL